MQQFFDSWIASKKNRPFWISLAIRESLVNRERHLTRDSRARFARNVRVNADGGFAVRFDQPGGQDKPIQHAGGNRQTNGSE